ncbi:MAG: DUF1971 domain-containing protein [Acidimicrobiales bacterium]
MSAPDELPDGLVLARTTPVFDRSNVPAGLLRAHQVAEGVWGRLVVHEGTVTFVFEDDPDHPRHGDRGDRIVIPPGRPHHVELDDSAAFAVEFHRPPSDSHTT